MKKPPITEANSGDLTGVEGAALMRLLGVVETMMEVSGGGGESMAVMMDSEDMMNIMEVMRTVTMIVVTILVVGTKASEDVMIISEVGTKASEDVMIISEDVMTISEDGMIVSEDAMKISEVGMKIPEVAMIILEDVVAVMTISEAVAAGGMDTEVGLIFVEVLKGVEGIEVAVVGVLPEDEGSLTTIVEVKGQDLLAVVDVDLIKRELSQKVIFGNGIILH